MRSLLAVIAALIYLSIAGLVGAFIRVVTLGKGIHFFRRVFVLPGVRWFLLPLAGIRVEWPKEGFDDVPVAYLFNHSSNLDTFVLSAIPIPRPRFFLSTDVWMYLPHTIAAWAMGTFFISSEDKHESRVKCFQRAERRLRATGDSFVASPEGRRIQGGVIGPFNKGVFHLAWSLRRKVVPLFIEIPPQENPGLGFHFRPTIVRIHRLEALEPGPGLDEKEILVLRDRCRERFVKAHRRFHGVSSGHANAIDQGRRAQR